MIDSQPLAYNACFGRRIQGPDAMAAPTVLSYIPAWDAGAGGSALVPGFARKHEAV